MCGLLSGRLSDATLGKKLEEVSLQLLNVSDEFDNVRMKSSSMNQKIQLYVELTKGKIADTSLKGNNIFSMSEHSYDCYVASVVKLVFYQKQNLNFAPLALIELVEVQLWSICHVVHSPCSPLCM